jgi:hypothetical protein
MTWNMDRCGEVWGVYFDYFLVVFEVFVCRPAWRGFNIIAFTLFGRIFLVCCLLLNSFYGTPYYLSTATSSLITSFLAKCRDDTPVILDESR